MDSSSVDGLLVDEITRRVSVVLTGVLDSESSANCDFDDIASELRTFSSRLSDLADSRCKRISHRSMVSNLESVLSSIKYLKEE
jgi:hypothetical protein